MRRAHLRGPDVARTVLVNLGIGAINVALKLAVPGQ